MDNNLPVTTVVNPIVKQPAPLNQKNYKLFLIIGGIVLVLIILVSSGYYFVKVRNQPQPVSVTPTPTPSVKEGAKFFLLADPIEATVGGQIKVSVLVKSDMDAANLFIAKLKFSNQLLQAKSINLKSEATSSGFIKNWFISNWVENTIDNNNGSVSLVGGVPTPGFQTQKESSGSAMADVIFVARAPGDGVISFDDTSTVYRNSDSANILVDKQGITLKITGEASSAAILIPTPTVKLTPVSSPSATPSDPSEGDVNQDGKTDLQDLSSLLSVWGINTSGPLKADLNKDGVVNAFDYSKLTKILKDAGALQ